MAVMDVSSAKRAEDERLERRKFAASTPHILSLAEAFKRAEAERAAAKDCPTETREEQAPVKVRPPGRSRILGDCVPFVRQPD